MKRSKTRAAKEITRSLKAQGAFATVFARNIDVSMCAIEERLTELGGYTNENLETALAEEIERSGLGDFVESPAGESVDRISGQLNKGVSQMQRIRPRLNKKQIDRYNDGLVDAILRKISAAGRMKGAFEDVVLSPQDGSLLKGRDRILRLAK